MTVRITDTFRVGAGESLTFTNEQAFRVEQPASGPDTALVIAGEVRAVADGSASGLGYITGVIAYDSFQRNDVVGVVVESTGSLEIVSTSAKVWSWGFQLPYTGVALDVENHGLIAVESISHSVGVSGGVAPTTFINTGVLRVVAEAGEAGGVEFSGGGTFRNTGLIEVIAGDDADGTWFNMSYGGGSTSFFNSGVIRVVDGTEALDSYGVWWASPIARGETWRNEGSIEGEYALKVYNTSGTFENAGALIGRVDMGDAGNRLVNSGEIRGDVNLAAGADVYDGRLGTLVGGAYGGAGGDTLQGGDLGSFLRGEDGADSLAGGAAFDDLHGNMGDDTVSGGGGDDWSVGGKDNDLLFGDEGADIVWGNLGSDTCDGGAGNDQVRGGQANDVVRGGDGDDWLSGDRGDDTLSGGAGADVFHVFSDAGVDVVTDFNAAEGDRVDVLEVAGYTVTQSGADVVLEVGDARLILQNVQVADLQPGWIF